MDITRPANVGKSPVASSVAVSTDDAAVSAPDTQCPSEPLPKKALLGIGEHYSLLGDTFFSDNEDTTPEDG